MNNLSHTNKHKFIVSLGIGLIVLPSFIMYLYFSSLDSLVRYMDILNIDGDNISSVLNFKIRV